MTQAVKVDASEVTKVLRKIEIALTKPGLNRLARKAEGYMKQSVAQSFATGTDPETGRPWAPMKRTYGNPPLRKDGELRGWVDTATHVWIGKRRSRLYLKFMWPDTARANIKAGSLFFGRKQARTGAGSKTGRPPRTGHMPGRKYMGLSRGAEKRIYTAAKTSITRIIGR